MSKTIPILITSFFVSLGAYGNSLSTPPTPFVPGTLNEVTVLPTPVDKEFHISGIWDINLDLSDPLSLTSLYVEALNLDLLFSGEGQKLIELATKGTGEIDFGNLSSKCSSLMGSLESWYACMNNGTAANFGTGSNSFFSGNTLVFGFGTGALSGSGGVASNFSSSGAGGAGSSGGNNGNNGGGEGTVGNPPPTSSPSVPIPEPFTIIILGGMTAAGAYLKYRKSSE